VTFTSNKDKSVRTIARLFMQYVAKSCATDGSVPCMHRLW